MHENEGTRVVSNKESKAMDKSLRKGRGVDKPQEVKNIMRCSKRRNMSCVSCAKLHRKVHHEMYRKEGTQDVSHKASKALDEHPR